MAHLGAFRVEIGRQPSAVAAQCHPQHMHHSLTLTRRTSFLPVSFFLFHNDDDHNAGSGDCPLACASCRAWPTDKRSSSWLATCVVGHCWIAAGQWIRRRTAAGELWPQGVGGNRAGNQRDGRHFLCFFLIVVASSIAAAANFDWPSSYVDRVHFVS